MSTVNALLGLAALNRRLKAIQDNRDLLREIQIRVVAEAKHLVPRRTGNLGRTIHPGSLTNVFAIVEATAPYAAYVELGTKAHVIKPRNKRVLAWPATAAGARLSGRARAGTRRGGSGGLRFARLVHHPGTKPQPYLVPAARLALKKAGVSQVIERWNRAA